MQSAAHAAATIECLGLLLTAWHKSERLPADVNFERYSKARRFIGSKDRAMIAERYYFILRELGALEELTRDAPGFQPILPYPPQAPNGALAARLLMIATLLLRNEVSVEQLAIWFNGQQYHPSLLTDGEWQWVHQLAKQLPEFTLEKRAEYNCPNWLKPIFRDKMGTRFDSEMAALSQEAPVDLRANTLKTSRDALLELLANEGFDAAPTSISPIGIRLKKRAAIFASPLFKSGLFEMQDEGSQVTALLVDAKPGMRIIDFCAGSGGKTLAIAAEMKNRGKILAFDTSAKRLGDLPIRLKRAGVDNTEWHTLKNENDAFIKRHKGMADRVLVDAPCSGTGTWRRNPDAKWRLTPTDINELTTLQTSILKSAARLVKPGGRLIYSTCSLIKRENENNIETFLHHFPKFRVVCAKKIWDKESNVDDGLPPSYLDLSPGVDGTDGFFAAVLELTA